MSEHPGPPSLRLALSSVVGAAVDSSSREGLLFVVRPDAGTGVGTGIEGFGEIGQGRSRVVPFPSPRGPVDDDPDAA